MDSSLKGTEFDLKTGESRPKIFFRLDLVFDDTGQVVRPHDAKASGSLLRPNILGCERAMHDGEVAFDAFHMQLLSSHVKNRKLRFVLTCTSPDLAKYEHMHASSMPFWSLSRLKKDISPASAAGE